jgi:hypothetical protein
MGGLLTGETEAEFGYLSFGRVRFRPVDPDIRACIGTNVARPAHLKFTLAPAAFVVMAATMCNNQAPTQMPLCRAARRCWRKRSSNTRSGLAVLSRWLASISTPRHDPDNPDDGLIAKPEPATLLVQPHLALGNQDMQQRARIGRPALGADFHVSGGRQADAAARGC